MGRMKDLLIESQDRDARRFSDDEQAARDAVAELTGILSGCYDAVRSMRHSAELDQDVVITLRATECDGDVFFLATYEPLGIVLHGYDYAIQQTAQIHESLSASFDAAIKDFDDQVYCTRYMRQLNG
jgi:hypothetical protein